MTKFVTVDEVRESLLSLASAYERLADAAEFDLIEHLAAAHGSAHTSG